MILHRSLLRALLWSLLCLVIAPTAAAIAQQNDFESISWSPSSLQSGSPVLFAVQLDGPAAELHGTWLDHPLVFARAPHGNTWFALAGIDVEQAPATYVLDVTATGPGGVSLHATRQVAVELGRYKTTTLHVEEKYVQPDTATLARIAADKAVKDAAFARLTPQPLWRGNFQSPVRFTPTDSFGTRRTFNGTLASVHRGTDFHAPAGTPVLAANDGVVILAQGMFYEGNLVVIDHGQQFTTTYMHLSKIEVKAGQRVAKGERIGLSGATGRVTGPHLHMGARWQGMYVDPVILFGLKLPAL